MEDSAKRLAQALDASGMSQAELSRRTGIGKSSISTYLKGEYMPKQKNIYKIARVLDVSEPWLMGLDVPMERNSLWADPRDREFVDSIIDMVKPMEELTERQGAIKTILNSIGRDIVKVQGRINYIGDRGAFVIEPDDIEELFSVAKASVLSIVTVIERKRREDSTK